jgi:hypothetical protein
MKFSMIGQEKGGLMGRFDCINIDITVLIEQRKFDTVV